jgi:ribosomal protein S18 acetylase RimI-like enzyme
LADLRVEVDHGCHDGDDPAADVRRSAEGGRAVIDVEPELPWVRTATREDADAIGSVQVRAWQAAYPGMMPQAYLDGLDVGERRAFWRQGLAAPPPGGQLLVACQGAAVVGFAVCGPEEFSEASGRGQVYALNVDPSAWGIGAGAALLRTAQDRLVAAGFGEAVLWVIPGNARARRFYERHGWEVDSLERPAEVFGVTITEMRYRRRLP